MVLLLVQKKRKNVDVLKHFKRIILRDIKPISTLLAEQVTYLGTFSRVIPDMLGYNIISMINKIHLLYRLDKEERVNREVVNEVLDIIRSIEVSIRSSNASANLKAYGLSNVVVAYILLGEYDRGVGVFDEVAREVESIQDTLRRSIAIADVLFNLGTIRRYTKRKSQNIPEDVVNSLANNVSPIVQKVISEAEFIKDAYVRGRIYANIGFGTRLFTIFSREEIIAQWYDINQSQRLALDAIDEAEKIGDWYRKGIILADAAAVLAISGEDTVGLSSEKFDEAIELAFKHLKKYPIRAASLLGRIAYDKAFTRFYVDSDKYFFESIIIPLEVGGLEEGLPTIVRILRLASKVRYFYVVYEVVRDWLLPLIEKETNFLSRAKYLSVCANIALPVSISWAVNIAREALSMTKSVVDSEILPLYYDTIFMGDMLAYAYNIIKVLPTLANVAFPLPHETIKIVDRVFRLTENITKSYLRMIRRKIRRGRMDEIFNFIHELGVFMSFLRNIPVLYDRVYGMAEQFTRSVHQIFKILFKDSPIIYIPHAYLIHGAAGKPSELVVRKAREILERIFKYEKNMWIIRNKDIYKRITRDGEALRIFGDLMGLLGEVALRSGGVLSDTYTRIITDLSEVLDQKAYTDLLVAVLERIERKDVTRKLLHKILNILIDEQRVMWGVMSKKLYRIINNIDPVLAKFLIEEVSG